MVSTEASSGMSCAALGEGEVEWIILRIWKKWLI